MSTTDEFWRLFIAIELPSNVRRTLKDHIDHLRDAIPDARASWAREENLHLTLKFLGDMTLTSVERLSQATQRAASAVAPFEMIIGTSGAFPPNGQPRVLWIGIEDPAGELAVLHEVLEDQYVQAGFARENRPYHPHLTIARLRQAQGARRLSQIHKEMGFDQESLAVTHLALIRSELLREGSRHTVVARHPFSPA